MKLAALSVGLLGITLCIRADERTPDSSTAAAMQAAAVAFLDGLDDEQRGRATFAFDHEERRAWSNLPHTMFERLGVRFGEMTAEQKVLAHRLIQSPLSGAGYLKVSGIMHIDEILLDFARARGTDGTPAYGHDYYWIGIFGDPAEDSVWGWQLDGHHLALNFTVVGNKVAVTPAFLGGNPAEVRDGVYAGFRPLGSEDDRGRQLFASLDDAQRELAVVAEASPGDVITGPKRAHMLTEIAGLPAEQMNDAQRDLLLQLIREWADNLDSSLASEQLARILDSGVDAIHFAWAGTGEGEPYYYRVHGPTVLIEFSNARAPGRRSGSVNHIHSVWRDLDRDYGGDLLRAHYEEHHR